MQVRKLQLGLEELLEAELPQALAGRVEAVRVRLLLVLLLVLFVLRLGR